MKYNVGDRVIDYVHQEDLTIVAVNEDRKSYSAKVDRLPDVGPFEYRENELEPWRYRRFVIDGNHYMQLHDCEDQFNPKYIGSGTWGIRDTVTKKMMFYITSGHSRAIAMEIIKKMNEERFLKDLAY